MHFSKTHMILEADLRTHWHLGEGSTTMVACQPCLLRVQHTPFGKKNRWPSPTG